MREFHLTRKIRDKYQFDNSLFSYDGNVIFANFNDVRLFTQSINDQLDLRLFPEQSFKAGEINAIGLMDEIFHLLIDIYQGKLKIKLFQDLNERITKSFSEPELDNFFIDFINFFPPTTVYKGEISAEKHLNSISQDRPNRLLILEELILLWIANQNPALGHYKVLFDDNELKYSRIYANLIEEIQSFFKTQPAFGPSEENLFDMLGSPAIHEPNSIFGQLDYIRLHWGKYLGSFLDRLLSSLDLIKEEQKTGFIGPGPIEIPVYDDSMMGFDEERFSSDQDWMPKLVMIAKNSYVWLDQLSKKYKQNIRKLSEIPEEELARLAEWGINGLWLIGLWERSAASARIKQLCGNPEAISSAYALSDYQIASDLGGDEAYQILNERAKEYGIRLASDMVPNHMAIDSRWVIEHPDWFLSLDQPPFPSYQFSGPNLSHIDHVELYLEDHYYDQTDASVVFKRVDRRNNHDLYIYHGNDGTSFPWNDTAQLNYLNPEVREAVIETIIQVAKKFQIIRFDAAMTLTKLHYQRLWFPEPGTGGDIPSRSNHTINNEAFSRSMPNEFWREVVDRIAIEAPNTLLLAEAFWLMESYFVRTLGMHRVYNSAFMNLLRNEENGKFRKLIKNTLEFDPQILKRFVNFLSNPDEKTAVEQFGKGDKYFGSCTLMVTLPGLPMFGHGQIEGFTEKYGMEYKKAYWDEIEDQYLIDNHRKKIFPLLQKRNLFSSVKNFLLYDFYNAEGEVEEDIIAFSNHHHGESALVIYNNKFKNSVGWIKTSAAYLNKSKSENNIVQNTLAEGLMLVEQPNSYLIFRDQIDQLEYIRPVSDIQNSGLYLNLDAYQAHVFLDMRQVTDFDQTLSALNKVLDGKGVPSIEDAKNDLFLRPVFDAVGEILNQGFLDYIVSSISNRHSRISPPQLMRDYETKLLLLLQEISSRYHTRGSVDDILAQNLKEFSTICRIASKELYQTMTISGGKKWQGLIQKINETIRVQYKQNFLRLLTWSLFLNTGGLIGEGNPGIISQRWFDEWKIEPKLINNFQNSPYLHGQTVGNLIRILIAENDLNDELNKKSINQIIHERFDRQDIQSFIGLHRANEIDWIHKESFNTYLDWLLITNFVRCFSRPGISFSEGMEIALGLYESLNQIKEYADQSGYQVEILFQLLDSENSVD